MEKSFINFTYNCSFKFFEETYKVLVKEKGEEIILKYELIKANNKNLIPFLDFLASKSFRKYLTHSRLKNGIRLIIAKILLIN